MKFGKELTPELITEYFSRTFNTSRYGNQSVNITHRYKTVPELEKEFGKSWRYIGNGWNSGMDILLGGPYIGPAPTADKTHVINDLGWNLYTGFLTPYTDEQAQKISNIYHGLSIINRTDTEGIGQDKVKIFGSGNYATITYSPTGNCQLSAFGCFNQLMSAANNDSIEAGLLFQMALIKAKVVKPLVLIDIKRHLLQYIADWPILVNHPYVSTNGSNMVLITLKIN